MRTLSYPRGNAGADHPPLKVWPLRTSPEATHLFSSLSLLLPPFSAVDQERRAAVTSAPLSFSTISCGRMTRIAHRIYGRALEVEQPPSSSGIDIWVKNVRCGSLYGPGSSAPGRQHDYHGEGLDFYNVNGARCRRAGHLARQQAWVSRNYVRPKILQDGPDHGRVRGAGWRSPAGRGRCACLGDAQALPCPPGTNFTRMVSTIRSDNPRSADRRHRHQQAPDQRNEARWCTFTADKATGRASWWGPPDPDRRHQGGSVADGRSQGSGRRDRGLRQLPGAGAGAARRAVRLLYGRAHGTRGWTSTIGPSGKTCRRAEAGLRSIASMKSGRRQADALSSPGLGRVHGKKKKINARRKG